MFAVASQRWKHIGLIDEDIGQARLGLPTCIWGAIRTRYRTQVVCGEFIGSLTPAGLETAFVAAAIKTKAWLESEGANMIIIDSPGFVFGSQAALLHKQQVSLLRPDWILALESTNTLSPLLTHIGFPGVTCLPTVSELKPRSLAVRMHIHQNRFGDYFKQSRIVIVSMQNRVCWFLDKPLTYDNLGQNLIGHIMAFTSGMKPLVGQLEGIDKNTRNIRVRIPKGIKLPSGNIVIGNLHRRKDGVLSHLPNLANHSNIRLHFRDQVDNHVN